MYHFQKSPGHTQYTLTQYYDGKFINITVEVFTLKNVTLLIWLDVIKFLRGWWCALSDEVLFRDKRFQKGQKVDMEHTIGRTFNRMSRIFVLQESPANFAMDSRRVNGLCGYCISRTSHSPVVLSTRFVNNNMYAYLYNI